jgi:small subunit ribosomal protein S2
MFVGTKPQAREVIQEEATRSGSFYVTQRWLGGTLSNFQTVRNSIERMRRLEDLLKKSGDPASNVKMSKNERLMLSREIGKLSQSLGGIREMRRLPDVMFIVDIIKEEIAVAEARRLQIPIVALVDTNTDPTKIDIPVPANDDAARTVALLTAAAADAIMDARRDLQSRQSKDTGSREVPNKDQATVATSAPAA